MQLSREKLIEVFEPLLANIGGLEHTDEARSLTLKIITDQLNAKFEPDGSSYTVDCIPPPDDNEVVLKYKYVTITDFKNKVVYDLLINADTFHVTTSLIEE
jgi:hypothetical protein